MAEEIEKKFLDIEVDGVKKRLGELGAKQTLDILYRKMFFDHPDGRFQKSEQWLRLRDEGDKITLTYKRLDPGKSMEEVEIKVSDFNLTEQLLYKAGFVLANYAENKRQRYQLGDVEIDIDTYPLIPTYLEIEAPSYKALDDTAFALGIDPKKGLITSLPRVFTLYGIDYSQYKVVTFERQEKR